MAKSISVPNEGAFIEQQGFFVPVLILERVRKTVDSRQRVWTLFPNNLLHFSLYHLTLCVLPLLAECLCQAVHARQCVWMLRS
jgi:membrane associated rhomboid family serine protease